MAGRVGEGTKRLSWLIGALGILCWGGVLGRWLFVSWDDLQPKDTLSPKIEGVINKAGVEAREEQERSQENVLRWAEDERKDAVGGASLYTEEQRGEIVEEGVRLSLEIERRTFEAKRDSIKKDYFAQQERKKVQAERKLKVYLAVILPAFLLPWGLVRALAWVAAGFKKEQG